MLKLPLLLLIPTHLTCPQLHNLTDPQDMAVDLENKNIKEETMMIDDKVTL